MTSKTVSPLDISVIILTFNEAIHLERCLASIRPLVKNIFVVDSYSTDATREIAQRFDAKVYQNPWKNYATQFNFGLEHCPIDTEWVIRLDADEYLTPALCEEIREKLPKMADGISAIYFIRRVFFLGRWMRHGGSYPLRFIRMWRHGKGICEVRWMDEHIKIFEGDKTTFENDMVDDNLQSLTWWIQKHNTYASREAVDILNTLHHFLPYEEIEPRLMGTQDERKRWLKQKYLGLPLFIRPFFYFLYRYFYKLGFLDGVPGFVWNVLQGFWYRFLVDAKIYQLRQYMRKNPVDIKVAIREVLHLSVD